MLMLRFIDEMGFVVFYYFAMQIGYSLVVHLRRFLPNTFDTCHKRR